MYTFPRIRPAARSSSPASGPASRGRSTLRALFLGAVSQLVVCTAMASTFNGLGGAGLLTEGPPPQCEEPVVVITLADMGLQLGDQIDALSFGDDLFVGFTHVLTFSVDAVAAGASGTGVEFEVTSGTAPTCPGPTGPTPPEASGDVFWQRPTSSNSLAGGRFGYGGTSGSGDEGAAAWTVADDLDAFDYSDDPTAGGVYFSLAAGSPSLMDPSSSLFMLTPGDIFFVLPGNGAPVLSPALAVLAGEGPATDVNLGIAGDDLDALNLVGDESPNLGTILAGQVGPSDDTGPFPATSHLVQWSIAPGLSFAPGDVLVRTPTGDAMVHTPAAGIGLRPSDNLNALEAHLDCNFSIACEENPVMRHADGTTNVDAKISLQGLDAAKCSMQIDPNNLVAPGGPWPFCSMDAPTIGAQAPAAGACPVGPIPAAPDTISVPVTPVEHAWNQCYPCSGFESFAIEFVVGGYADTVCGGKIYAATKTCDVLINHNDLYTELTLDETHLQWTPVDAAVGYDVVAGDLNSLRSSGGDYQASTSGCVVENDTDTTEPQPSDPDEPGEGIWILVRAEPESDMPSYEHSPSQFDRRDSEIRESAVDCLLDPQELTIGFSTAGRHLISLPRVILSPSITSAQDLLDALAAAGLDPNSVARWDTSIDDWQTWTGGTCAPCGGSCFCIDPLEGWAYLVDVGAPASLVLQGFDTTSEVVLLGPGAGSLSGRHAISLPFSSSLGNADGLLNDIGPAAHSVGRYLTGSDVIQIYTGASGSNFSVAPGEGYFVYLSQTTAYCPPVSLVALGGAAFGLLGVWLVRVHRRDRRTVNCAKSKATE